MTSDVCTLSLASANGRRVVIGAIGRTFLSMCIEICSFNFYVSDT